MSEEEKKDKGQEPKGQESQDPDGGGKEPGEKRITLTPTQLEERLARERKKFADYDNVKSQLAELQQKEKERTDAELTEVERLKSELGDLQAERDGLQERFHDTLIRSAVEREAAKANFHDPSDAYDLADVSMITIDDEGKVMDAEKAIAALVKAKAHLVKTAPHPDTDADKGKKSKAGEGEKHKEDLRRRFGL